MPSIHQAPRGVGRIEITTHQGVLYTAPEKRIGYAGQQDGTGEKSGNRGKFFTRYYDQNHGQGTDNRDMVSCWERQKTFMA
jgi:hypothetical protein